MKIASNLVVILVVALVIVLAGLLMLSGGGSPREEQCANAEAAVLEVSPGEPVLLCEGQSAVLGDYKASLLSAGENPQLEVIHPGGFSKTYSLVKAKNVFGFFEVDVGEVYARGVSVSFRDIGKDSEKVGLGLLALSWNEPVRLEGTVVKLMIVKTNGNPRVNLLLPSELVEKELVAGKEVSFADRDFNYAMELVSASDDGCILQFYEVSK